MVRVRGYYRSDGTYVRSHHRNAPSRPARSGSGDWVLGLIVLLVLISVIGVIGS